LPKKKKLCKSRVGCHQRFD